MARQFYIVPLDKPGEDPTPCEDARPFALRSPLMRVLEMRVARRILLVLERRLPSGQFAYKRAGGAGALPSDLDLFVTQNRGRGWATDVAGLDISGAYDCAAQEKIVGAVG